MIYEESGEDSLMTPVWMVIDNCRFDWSELLHIDIQAPFERLTYDDIDSDHVAVTVPEAAYTRLPDQQHVVGIRLENVRKGAFELLKKYQVDHDYDGFDLSPINRLVLRINDIEDVLQYDVSKYFKK